MVDQHTTQKGMTVLNNNEIAAWLREERENAIAEASK